MRVIGFIFLLLLGPSAFGCDKAPWSYVISDRIDGQILKDGKAWPYKGGAIHLQRTDREGKPLSFGITQDGWFKMHDIEPGHYIMTAEFFGKYFARQYWSAVLLTSHFR